MSYQKFAYYYDSLMDPQFYDDYINFINDKISFNSVLELACGTGEMTIRLLKNNKSVVATDLSQDMLEVLHEKITYYNYSIPIYRLDMRDFEADEKVDAVFCFCDSINYVLELSEIKKVFSNVYHSLHNPGYFIFDINSLHKHNVILNDYNEEIDDDEFYFHWQVNSSHNGEVIHHLEIIDKIENEKVDEMHFQKTYDIEVYKTLLEEVGFKKIEIFSDFESYDEYAEKHIFVCYKNDNYKG